MAALTLVAGALALASFGLAAGLAVGSPPHASQPHRVLPLPSASARARAAVRPKVVRPRQMPRPVRIVIPAIGVSAPIIPLHLNRDGTLQVPRSFSQTGWFVGGPEPGEIGPAVIVGHVDSYRGPAVFFRLRALTRGDLIKVIVKGGRTLKFVVRSSRAAPKKHFPTHLVYGRTKTPTLRLITCDGRFDRSTGHYVDNHIVFADLV